MRRWWRSRAARWSRKGFASVLDEGVFAGANFALNILMARWLPPEVYGIFAVAHTVFLLSATAYGGLFLEPMLIFGPSAHKKEMRPYLGSVLHLHGYFGGLALAVFGVGALGVGLGGASDMVAPLIAVALATPLILILWIARKACYLWLEPRRAVGGGLMYLLLLLPGAYMLHRLGWLGPSSAFLLMGVTSAAAGGWLLKRLAPLGMLSPASDRLRQVAREHWEYGRWAASTRLLNWVPHHVYFLILPLWVTMEATGTLKALLNVLSPMVHLYAAVTVLFMTVLVRLRDEPAFDRALRRALAVFGAVGVAFWLLLGLFGPAVVGFLYRGKFVDDAGLFWVLGAVPLLNGLTAFITAGLRALEEPEKVFYIYAGAALVALTVGLPLMGSLGLAGAALGLVASGLASAVIAAVVLGRTRQTVWLPGAQARARGEAVG